jgi:hypothetical protein
MLRLAFLHLLLAVLLLPLVPSSYGRTLAVALSMNCQKALILRKIAKLNYFSRQRLEDYF